MFSLHRKLRERDATIFHIQLCIALFCMMIVFVSGIDRTSVYGGCVLVSVLIHYFTLAAVMFMGAEAVLMFKKLIIVFGQTTAKFFVAISLICWRKCMIVSHLHYYPWTLKYILVAGYCFTTNSPPLFFSCTNHSCGDPTSYRPLRCCQR